QVETGMVLAGVPTLDYQVNGREYSAIGNGSRWPGVAPHGIYRGRDADTWIAIAVETDDDFGKLCGEVGLERLASDARFARNEDRVRHEAELNEIMEGVTREREV